MVYKKIIAVLFLLSFLSGCAITNEVYLPLKDGKIDKTKPTIQVKQSGASGFIYRKQWNGAYSVEVDSRKPTLWERFIGPIIGKASESTTGTVTAK